MKQEISRHIKLEGLRTNKTASEIIFHEHQKRNKYLEELKNTKCTHICWQILTLLIQFLSACTTTFAFILSIAVITTQQDKKIISLISSESILTVISFILIIFSIIITVIKFITEKRLKNITNKFIFSDIICQETIL